MRNGAVMDQMARTVERDAVRVTAGAIVMARHGKPALDRAVKLDWRGYQEWWRSYEFGGLAAGQTPPQALIAAAADSQVIFSSTRRRAIETAEAVAGGRPIIEDSIFIEAPLPPPHLPGRHSPDFWGVVSRSTWWLGFSDGEESRAQADLRAEAAAATLAARALRGENVLLLAHGWFNRMIGRELREAGWSRQVDGGDSHWAFRRYVRRG